MSKLSLLSGHVVLSELLIQGGHVLWRKLLKGRLSLEVHVGLSISPHVGVTWSWFSLTQNCLRWRAGAGQSTEAVYLWMHYWHIEGSGMWQFGVICDNKFKSSLKTIKQASKTTHNTFNSQWLCPLRLNSVCPFSVEVGIMDLTSTNILCLERQHGLRNKNIGVRIEQTWQN